MAPLLRTTRRGACHDLPPEPITVLPTTTAPVPRGYQLCLGAQFTVTPVSTGSCCGYPPRRSPPRRCSTVLEQLGRPGATAPLVCE